MPTKTKRNIFAIDDTLLNRVALGGALEVEFDLQIATSVESGIALATGSAPDLIGLDVMMPSVDGFETFRRLKADAALMQVPDQPTTMVQYHCTASIGACLLRHQDGDEGDFLKWADKAVYVAKGAGRNQIHFCGLNAPQIQ